MDWNKKMSQNTTAAPPPSIPEHSSNADHAERWLERMSDVVWRILRHLFITRNRLVQKESHNWQQGTKRLILQQNLPIWNATDNIKPNLNRLIN